MHGKCGVLQVLLKEGVELGVVNRRQWCAVHYAAFHGRLGILQVSYHGRIVLEVVDMSSFISQTCFFLIGGTGCDWTKKKEYSLVKLTCRTVWTGNEKSSGVEHPQALNICDGYNSYIRISKTIEFTS